MALAPLLSGTVIPAHPLALNSSRQLDERRQRALTRYYLASGAGGVAVGVHTTQFAIREAGLFRPVLELAAETIKESGREVVAVAGVCGPVEQAVAEASLAADLGYDAVLLSPVVPGADEAELLVRAKAVGEVLPVIGFYLQTAIGGPVLSRGFWRALADQPSTAVRSSAARWRPGRCCSAARNASRMLCRRMTRSAGLASSGTTQASGTGSSHSFAGRVLSSAAMVEGGPRFHGSARRPRASMASRHTRVAMR